MARRPLLGSAARLLLVGLGFSLLTACYPWVDQEQYELDNPVFECEKLEWFVDEDGDGFGVDSDRVERCLQPTGYAHDSGDCDDTDPLAFPGGAETPYDSVDQDCDGSDLCDTDGDEQDAVECGGDDCDDGNDAIGLGFLEVPYDGIDQDCSGADLCDDDGDGLDSFEFCGGDDCDDNDPVILDEPRYYPDLDADNYGDEDEPGTACEPSDPSDVVDATDCDDLDSVVNPGQVDLVGDGIDNDCDGSDGVDADGDGEPSEASGGEDCDDGDPTVLPGAIDDPGDGIDKNCDGADGFDGDGDGYAVPADCDDLDPAQYPGALEWCNGEDDDCDSIPDNNAPEGVVVFYLDADSDSYGNANQPVLACSAPSGYVADSSDCDDSSSDIHPGVPDIVDGIDNDCDGADGVDEDADGVASEVSGGADCDDTDPSIHPAAVEIPYDGVDQDCSGADLCDVDADSHDSALCGGGDCDDADPATGDDWYYPDVDGDGFGGGGGVHCDPTGLTNAVDVGGDCDDTLADRNPGMADVVSDGIDDNCDGVPGVDSDRDGRASDASGGDDCDDADPSIFAGAPDLAGDGVDADCDGVDGEDADGDLVASVGSGGTDCDDLDPYQYPGAPEYCDGEDGDCDGVPDNNLPLDMTEFFLDSDADSFGDPATGMQACSAPLDHVLDDTDCNDSDFFVNPTRPDQIANGVDNNCDGVPGVDGDADGVASAASGGLDCDDADPTSFPGAVDIAYDGVDQDCDGSDFCDVDGDGDLASNGSCGGGDCDDSDPFLGDVWGFDDLDGDSFGAGVGLHCPGPLGALVDNGLDCDDANAGVFPGQVDDVANQVDDNCDGVPGVDSDLDGRASEASGGDDCDDTDPTVFGGAPDTVANGVDNDCDGVPGVDGDGDGEAGEASGGTDCDDDDPARYTGAPEYCNGVDDDCDLVPDNNSPIDLRAFYLDFDSDGYGDPLQEVWACSQPVGYQANDLDCDDLDGAVHPDPAPSDAVGDGVDSDCDGVDGVDGDLDGFASLASGGSDCDDGDPTIQPGAFDVPYDGIDQDCDGADQCDVDGDGADSQLCGGGDCDDGNGGLGEVWYYSDVDGDSFGAGLGSHCVQVDPSDVTNDLDCDDTRADRYPGLVGDLVSDGIDNNCDGVPGVDADSDGRASEASLGDDCDDTDPDIFGGAPDLADNGVDNNCDGIDGVDADGDLVASLASGGLDCDDADDSQYPGAPEYCTGEDDDCDGVVDNNSPADRTLWYLDFDSDSYGAPLTGMLACAAPSNYVADDTDCDDAAILVFPGAADNALDGVDNNCDGVPGVDGDGDGFASLVSDGTDCHDGDPAAWPGALEVPYDGVDQDCNGSDLCDVDGDGLDALVCLGQDCDDNDGGTGAIWWYPDVDGDTYGDALSPGNLCSPLIGSDVLDNTDCDDQSVIQNPGLPDFIDGVDNNCDGIDGVDDDGDGWASKPSGGTDCDDDDPASWPGAVDSVLNGVDNNCDGIPGVDLDGDLYASLASDGDDCDDVDPFQYPGAAEYCNGEDEDCDGVDDNNFPVDEGTFYLDSDSDGYGDPTTGDLMCAAALGWVADGTDCDDTNGAIHPGLPDLATNGVDDNCDGVPGIDGDGDGYASIGSGGIDCNDAFALINPGIADFADNAVDNDCDGTPGVDADGDGWASIPSLGTDCDDTDPLRYPFAPDTWGNGIDNDCDGTPGIDDDGDGTASLISGGDDCDDTDPTIFVGAVDVPYDGIDQDCDGIDLCDVDADGEDANECGGIDCDDFDAGWILPEWWYPDDDVDGYGDRGDGSYICVPPVGHVQDNQDCDDTDPAKGLGVITDVWINATDNASVNAGAVFSWDGGPNKVATYNRSSVGWNIRGWSKFDLSALQAMGDLVVDEATLYLYRETVSGSPQIVVHYSPGDAWSQAGVDASNPSLGPIVSTTITTSFGAGYNGFAVDPLVWDIQADIQDGWLSLGIDDIGAPDSRDYAYFEGTGNVPTEPEIHVVTYTCQ